MEAVQGGTGGKQADLWKVGIDLVKVDIQPRVVLFRSPFPEEGRCHWPKHGDAEVAEVTYPCRRTQHSGQLEGPYEYGVNVRPLAFRPHVVSHVAFKLEADLRGQRYIVLLDLVRKKGW